LGHAEIVVSIIAVAALLTAYPGVNDSTGTKEHRARVCIWSQLGHSAEDFMAKSKGQLDASFLGSKALSTA
jgi:hypothetical protein